MDSVNDMAQSDNKIQCKPDGECKGFPVFDINDPAEFHSFCRGHKSRHRWAQHTREDKIRNWANQNPYKSFYVKNGENHYLVNRSKKAKEI